MTVLNYLKQFIIPSTYNVGDIVNYHGQKRVAEVKYFTLQGDFFYYFEGKHGWGIAEKEIRKYEKSNL